MEKLRKERGDKLEKEEGELKQNLKKGREDIEGEVEKMKAQLSELDKGLEKEE